MCAQIGASKRKVEAGDWLKNKIKKSWLTVPAFSTHDAMSQIVWAHSVPIFPMMRVFKELSVNVHIFFVFLFLVFRFFFFFLFLACGP